MTERPQLRLLADRVGIIPEYVDCEGVVHRTSDPTREALLAAMGLGGGTEGDAEILLRQLEDQDANRILEPVRTIRGGTGKLTIPLRVPPCLQGTLDYRVQVALEDGGVLETSGRATCVNGSVESRLEFEPVVGYHWIRASLMAGGLERESRQLLIVSPLTCLTPVEVLGDRRCFGLWANLYTLRSGRNWGVGDMGDLMSLMTLVRQHGGAAVGLSPLHATRNSGHAISPYRPVSRLFNNHLYLDPGAVPELKDSPAARRVMESGSFAQAVEQLRGSRRVDYERIQRLQRPVVEELHRTFRELHQGARTCRGRDYDAYVLGHGRSLQDFATFMALADHFEREHVTGGWRSWPVGYRDRDSAEVASFRIAHRAQIELHCYLQYELDRQLGAASGKAAELGMPIGIFKDLAVGVDPDGCETWSWPGLFVPGASIGAPPDPLGPEGQVWGLPPIDPQALRESFFEHWIELMRSSLAHCGALRIDHVMGLERQFWVPRDCPSAQGAYVKYPADELFAILAIESRRNGALIVGEDLGTVPHGFRERLSGWGILGSHVLCLEFGPDGELIPPEHHRPLAVASLNTHDLAPLAGWWQGRDLTLRRHSGVLGDDDRFAEHQDRRVREKHAFRRHLSGDAAVTGQKEPAGDMLCGAAHRVLGRSSAAVVTVSLDDLAGETEPVNLPGVAPDAFEGWSRRMNTAIEDLPDLPAVRQLGACMDQRRW